jgi:hypothetical protein
MTQQEKPGQHWDRDQVERDNPGADATETDEVWNRQQMEFDNTGTDREGTGREALPEDLTRTDAGTADMDHVSGRGMPSGEGHFERNDPTE